MKSQTHTIDDERTNPYFKHTPKELKYMLKKRGLIFNGSKDKCVARLLVDDLSHQIERIFKDKLLIGYTFGSRLYGNAKKDSDYDFLVLMKASAFDQTFDEEILRNENADIRSMDWFFNVGWFPDLPEVRLDFKNQRLLIIDESFYQEFPQYEPSQIYNSFGLTSKTMWLLVKRQLENLAGDSAYSAENCTLAISPKKFHSIEKHMYNSFRILTFGIQMAKFGKINNFRASNSWRAELVNQIPEKVQPREHFLLIEKQQRLKESLLNVFQYFRTNCKLKEDLIDLGFLQEHKMRMLDYNTISEQAFQYDSSVLRLSHIVRNLNSPEITNNWLLRVNNTQTLYNLSLVCKQFYKIVHDKNFVRDLCLLHFGRSACWKFFGLEDYQLEEDQHPYNMKWFECFKIKSWFSQFGTITFTCPLCKKENPYYSERFRTQYQLDQAYRESFGFVQQPLRGKVFVSSCSSGEWSNDTYWRNETHMWGKILLSHFDQVWNSLPMCKEKAPPCVMCPATFTKNAAEWIFPGKSATGVMCTNGHFSGQAIEFEHRRLRNFNDCY